MKLYRVVIEPEAQEDLTRIYAFIAQEGSPLAARRFLRLLQSKIQSLESMPHRFRSSLYISDESVRDMIVKGYTVCYAIREERVHVLTVFRQRDYDE